MPGGREEEDVACKAYTKHLKDKIAAPVLFWWRSVLINTVSAGHNLHLLLLLLLITEAKYFAKKMFLKLPRQA